MVVSLLRWVLGLDAIFGFGFNLVGWLGVVVCDRFWVGVVDCYLGFFVSG